MAHLGNTIVNGALRVLGGENVDTINGVTVGSSPKFTDASVTQTATTTDANYEVLFSATADNTTRTEGARKTSTLRFNPSKGALMEGQSTVASGTNAHAEGIATTASGDGAHAESIAARATGDGSHAEGNNTSASGQYSHAEGLATYASGARTHAEGTSTTALGQYSHAEGQYTCASGSDSHAEGNATRAIGSDSHAEGNFTRASAMASHAEGYNTTASSNKAHAEGEATSAANSCAHAEGYGSIASGQSSHAEGNSTIASGNYSHAEGSETTAQGTGSHAEGNRTSASGDYSHSEGQQTTASSEYSHAEGYITSASGKASHAEGYQTKATANYAHAEGRQTTASSEYSHAEGYITSASGNFTSHAEGYVTSAFGNYGSHSEGYKTRASGTASHAEGDSTTASGNYSHASGQGTSAGGECQTVIGKYNVADTTSAFIIGNGSNSVRSNALSIDWNGNFYTDKLMKVYKESSVSTSTVGTWTAMCRSDQSGSPTLPTANRWWNVINLNNWTNTATNWISQLAICTQDDISGVWWRCNDSGGTNISNSTWRRLADGQNDGVANIGNSLNFALTLTNNNKWYKLISMPYVGTNSNESFDMIISVSVNTYSYSNGTSATFLLHSHYRTFTLTPITATGEYCPWITNWRITHNSDYKFVDFKVTLPTGATEAYLNWFRINCINLSRTSFTNRQYTVYDTLTAATSGTTVDKTYSVNSTFRTLTVSEALEAGSATWTRTASTAGSVTLRRYGKVKELVIWGTALPAVSGAAVSTLQLSDPNYYPLHNNVQFTGSDDNSQIVIGYITTGGTVYLANRSTSPIYCNVTYM